MAEAPALLSWEELHHPSQEETDLRSVSPGLLATTAGRQPRKQLTKLLLLSHVPTSQPEISPCPEQPFPRELLTS